MDYRYGIVNECLGLVRQCNMPVNDKLCLETLLYHVKIALLNSRRKTKAELLVCSFEELLHNIQLICDREVDHESLSALISRIHGLLASLNSDYVTTHPIEASAVAEQYGNTH